MQTFPYQIENGNLIIQVDGLRAVVQTGTPDSMCTCGSLTLDGKQYATRHQTLRMTPAMLSRELGVEVDAMIGSDILSRMDYRINPFRQELFCSHDEIHPYGYAAHFNLFRSLPVVRVWVEARETSVLFNTGSRLTYLAPEIAQNFPTVGSTRAFYPGLGWFETPLHRVLIWMSGNDVELDVGLPPPPLLSTMQAARTRGVLGCDVFLGPGVFLASRRREVIWFWHDY